MVDIDSGYLFAELNSLTVGFSQAFQQDLTIRVDAEIKNGDDNIKWFSTNNVKHSSSLQVATKLNVLVIDEDETQTDEKPPESFVYRLNFDKWLQRTTYVDLTSFAVTSLANATLSLKFIHVNLQVVLKEVKTKKGEAPPPPMNEEVLFELNLPFQSVLQATSSLWQSSDYFSDLSSGIKLVVTNPNILVDKSYLSWKVAADNDLAEYVLGSNFIRWNAALFAGPPVSWSIHFKDTDKGKKATPQELRNKAAENIAKALLTQEKAASYIFVADTTSSGSLADLIPKLTIAGGTVAFDAVAAVNSGEDNIKDVSEFWSIKWSKSPWVFLHRSQVRSLLQLLQNDIESSRIGFELTKKPLPEGLALEGNTPLSLNGFATLEAFLVPETKEVTLSLANFTDGSVYNVAVEVVLSHPLVKLPVVLSVPDTSTADVMPSLTRIKIPESSLDVVVELQIEISNSINVISSEYLILYPSAGNNQNNNKLISLDRKTEFLQALTAKGVITNIREKLKPKLQQVIWEKYGPRGTSMAKSESPVQLPVPEYDSGAKDLDGVLNEMYVFLTKQCNIVLNKLYTDTLVDRLSSSLDGEALIDDDVATIDQKLVRLLRQADDMEADGRHVNAEQIHLERIQVANSAAQPIAEIYAKYGEFSIRQSAKLKISDPTSLFIKSYEDKGREILAKATYAEEVFENKWRTALVYAGCLIESSLYSKANDILLNYVLKPQLMAANIPLTLQNLEEFDGTASDSLFPVDPATYAFLAAYFSLQSFPLKARKALVLADRSFLEGNYSPPTSLHGIPRRTIVYCLADSAIFFSQYGFGNLVQESVKLMLSSEEAVSKKVNARGLPSVTVPFIRHKTKLAQSLAASFAETDDKVVKFQNAINLATESVAVAFDAEDKIDGWLAVASSQYLAQADVVTITESFIAAINISVSKPELIARIPLASYLSLGKLLIQSTRFEDALKVLLTACRAYTSSSLLLLIAVASLRLNKIVDAEDALHEANILDNRNADIWAYLTLLCLTSGPHRQDEAFKSLQQSLRLGVKNSNVLREIAVAYIAIDKLSIAEDLIRRVINLELNQSENGKMNSVTRKLFADVLAGQNQASKAVEEYQALINDDDNTDLTSRINAAEKCLKLLESLGRYEDLKSLQGIYDSLISAKQYSA